MWLSVAECERTATEQRRSFSRNTSTREVFVIPNIFIIIIIFSTRPSIREINLANHFTYTLMHKFRSKLNTKGPLGKLQHDNLYIIMHVTCVYRLLHII